MISNYLKIALRTLNKFRLYSILNIVGLGVAIAICITGYVNFRYSQSYDNFHQNSNRIFLLNSYRIRNQQRFSQSHCPTPLAPAIQSDIAGVRRYTRFASDRGILRYDNQVFNEHVHYLDENFLDIFTFPVIRGNQNALKDPNGIIITDEVANKYFGEEDPVGKQMIFSPDGQKEYDFVVRGVIKKPAANSSIQFEIGLPYMRQSDMLGYEIEKWQDWTSAAFVELDPSADYRQVEVQLSHYLSVINSANPARPLDGLFLMPLAQLGISTQQPWYSHPFNDGFHPSQIIVPSVIAVLVFILACVNYINTAIAYAAKRFKEIGVRKVIGGRQSALFLQFMSENILLCLLALLLGLVLAEPFMGFYNSLFPENYFTLNYLEYPGVLVFIIGLLTVTVLAAGIYPAWYMSRFNPIAIFQGKSRLGGTNPLIRILLVVQFSIGVIAILSGLMSLKNARYIEQVDLGFDRESVMLVPVRNYQNYLTLKNALQAHPAITHIGASKHNMGRHWMERDVQIGETTNRIKILQIGENFLETAGLELADGTVLDFALNTTDDRSILINETMALQYGWDRPIGQSLRITSAGSVIEYRVVGIVKDFHMSGLWVKIDPVILQKANHDDYQLLALKFKLDNFQEVSEFVQTTWQKLFPALPYEGYFQSSIIAETMAITSAIKKLSTYIAVITLFLACLGLFALVSINVAKRTREIGIRRVLGASFRDVSAIISREFLLIIALAGVIGSLAGYFMVEKMLASIWAYYTDFDVLPFVGTIGILLMVTILTISSKLYMVITSNPAESLRYE